MSTGDKSGSGVRFQGFGKSRCPHDQRGIEDDMLVSAGAIFIETPPYQARRGLPHALEGLADRRQLRAAGSGALDIVEAGESYVLRYANALLAQRLQKQQGDMIVDGE